MVIQTDASFSYQDFLKTKKVEGFISLASVDFPQIVEKHYLYPILGLKQYINVFELLGIARAFEKARELGARDVRVETDSMTAYYWSEEMKGVKSELHKEIWLRLQRAREGIYGRVVHIKRDKNIAGFVFETDKSNWKSL